MATPTRQQAEAEQRRIAALMVAAGLAIRSLFQRNTPLLQVGQQIAAYQYAAATAGARAMAGWAGDVPMARPHAFAGVSSLGFPVIEPVVAIIDKHVPAPAEALPPNWWDDAAEFVAEVERFVAAEVADAYRTASQVEMVGRGWQNYVRMLKPPSCDRCAILAGRIYRDLEAFARHPGCDCIMVPVQDWEDAHDKGLVSSFTEAFERGDVRGLSKADARAIADGADPTRVVNASRGTGVPGVTAAVRTELFGHRVKATTDNNTKRSEWRRANPTRLVRLRPESIYEHAKDRDDALRLLRLYGYLT